MILARHQPATVDLDDQPRRLGNPTNQATTPRPIAQATGIRATTGTTPAIPEIEKDQAACLLEHPFRPDQIKLKDGVQYVDGASIIQRLNDVLGTVNWSFRILGDSVQLEREVIIRGRLTAWIDDRKVIKEDFGAHDFARKKFTNKISDTATP